MNETIVTIEDAASSLPELAERVHASGEPALVTKAGLPFVRITPADDRKADTESLIAFLRQWRIDHPEPDEEFAQAIEETRKAVQPPNDPWE
jgi:antitoxin (DNA-binding transcriptional repressor) of toxin-antitoxin stability system